MTELEEFRAEKDEFFRTSPESPLTPEQQARFTGLSYFPENSALRFEVALEPADHVEVLEIPTSTGSMQSLRRAGTFDIEIEGHEITLSAFGDPEEGELFIPFRDTTSGKETYGGGRYVEPIALGDNLWLLDLNYAYNPYCAYNERWSCPLPPAENWLPVPVCAGEKKFDH